MTFQGHIQNGVAVFDEPMTLPDGTKVQIVPAASPAPKSLAERFQNIIGAADDLPADLAENHDHYLHGTPKK
jgi:hypothetical protein